MKILTLSNCPLIETQGSGYVIVNYARGLRALGHQVDLVAPEACEILPKLRLGWSLRLAVGFLLEAIARLIKHPYDVIEFYGGQAWLAVSVLTVCPGRRFAIVTHSNGLETHYAEHLRRHLGHDTIDGKPHRWYQRLLRPPVARAFSRPDGLVMVSRFDTNYAAARRYQPAERLLCLENPLPEEFLGQAVSTERSRSIGYCGPWVDGKGRKVIAQDIAKILVEFPDVRFTLVGVGADFSKESCFVPEIAERVTVLEFIRDKSELRQVYASFSVLVAPSIYESFCLVVAEAMACGCAVVAGRSGFAANLRDGEEVTLMTEPRSPFLYECVRKLLLDDGLRIRIAKAGHARVQSLRWETATLTLSETYSRWREDLRVAR